MEEFLLKIKKAPKLMKAILGGNIEKVSNLLYQGVDPNDRDEEGRSPIMRAAE
jgi:ankyrin repeat protein